MLGKPRAAQLHVRFRIATVEHIERQEAREALLDAESSADYTTLLAQVSLGLGLGLGLGSGVRVRVRVWARARVRVRFRVGFRAREQCRLHHAARADEARPPPRR